MPLAKPLPPALCLLGAALELAAFSDDSGVVPDAQALPFRLVGASLPIADVVSLTHSCLASDIGASVVRALHPIRPEPVTDARPPLLRLIRASVMRANRDARPVSIANAPPVRVIGASLRAAPLVDLDGPVPRADAAPHGDVAAPLRGALPALLPPHFRPEVLYPTPRVSDLGRLGADDFSQFLLEEGDVIFHLADAARLDVQRSGVIFFSGLILVHAHRLRRRRGRIVVI